jgi:hypothetical protein
MPIGSHFSIVSLDDVVTPASVTTAEQIEKANEAFDLSLSLGKEDGTCREATGTHYGMDDTYVYMIDKHEWVPRRIPCCHVDKEHPTGDISRPALYSPEYLEVQRRADAKVWACQWLVDPNAGSAVTFSFENLRFYRTLTPEEMRKNLVVYILVDPASEKKTSDWTCMWVVGLGPDKHYYVLDIVRDKLDVWGRVQALFDLVVRWDPYEVRYEKYSMQADTQVIEKEMEARKTYFAMFEVGGNIAKRDRINSQLGPIVSKRKLVLPASLVKVDSRGRAVDLVQSFLDDEFKKWPGTRNDDMMDALSRIEEPGMYLQWPAAEVKDERDSYARAEERAIEEELGNDGISWMGIG